MREILITSSVLILALLLLRGVFGKILSRRVQYALWGLVLLRLLAPVQLPAADFSVLSSVEPVRTAVEQQLEELRLTPELPVNAPEPGTTAPTHMADGAPPVLSGGEPEQAAPSEPIPAAPAVPTAGEVLRFIRWAGTGLAAAFFLLANGLFWLRLRNRRVTLKAEGCSRRVYLVEQGLPSPCLFGLFRPAIYLTPAAISSPARQAHVLAHEETHARHLDQLWALLRCVCLTVYWFDPLVWVAAAVSRTDCELACDEGALARLGEDERIPYGETLLSLIPVKRAPAQHLLAATTMTAGKKQIKDRITRIAHRPRQFAAAAVAVVMLAGLVCACTFTGAVGETDQPDAGPSDQDAGQSAAAVLDWGEPEVISLDGAQVYTPQPFTLETIPGPWKWMRERYLGEIETMPSEIFLLTSPIEEMRYFAVVNGEDEAQGYTCFLSMRQDSSMSGGAFVGNLLGVEGQIYSAQYETEDYRSVCDYFYVGENGTPFRLAQVNGDGGSFAADCDGDGEKELVAPGQLFFRRDGVVYLADIQALWQEAHPDYVWTWSSWSTVYRDVPHGSTLQVKGYVDGADGVSRDWTRYIRYDGENLLVYKDPQTMEDHVLSWVDAPEVVVEKAKEVVQAAMPHAGDVIGGLPGGEPLLETAEYDDWRVESIQGSSHQMSGIKVWAYSFNYEYHTTTPEKIQLAGGMYMTEDDWVMTGYPGCDYLFFREEEDGSLTFLWNETINDSELQESILEGLDRLGLLQTDPVYLAQTLWDEIRRQEEIPLNLTTRDGEGGGLYTAEPGVWVGNMPRDITSGYIWELIGEDFPGEIDYDAINYLTVGARERTETVGAEEKSLTFYQMSDGLVEYRNNGTRLWLRAKKDPLNTDSAYEMFDYDLFPKIRRWYDEAEIQGLSQGREWGIVIPDDGQSYEEIAQAWAEQFEGVMLRTTSGSKYKCTYLDIRDVRAGGDLPEDYFPEYMKEREHFVFSYSAVFIPENDNARNWLIAGSTDDEAEVEGAPEGVWQWWRTGFMFLDDDGWCSDGVGTGL